MDSVRDVIVTLLRNFGSAKEIRQYLRDYSNVESTRFAVIKVGGGIMSERRHELASALSFLSKVGLRPVIVHGGGPQLNTALEAAGVTTERIEGLRVTTPEVLEIARKVFQQENLNLVEALEARGVRARPIPSGVFEADMIDSQQFGLVGQVTRVHIEQIESAIRSQHVPVLSCLGTTAAGQILNINADTAARELSVALQPSKVIFLTPTGGLLDQDGSIISAINLAEDFDLLMSRPWVHSGMRLKLQEIKELLDRLPPTSSVSITSPDHLARELFTHRGSGTLVRIGERIRRYDAATEVDQSAVRTLITESFGRDLVPEYFESKAIEALYLADSCRAAAIITREDGMPYLDKFAVTQEAQGAGVGASLWERIRSEYDTLYWRARSDNPINAWYFARADGTRRQGEWIVFWYGIHEPGAIHRCIERATSIKPTLTDRDQHCEECTVNGTT
ncbi:MAG: acetylglutamate kinase [Planctomycetes bacterium]|nr:acetylglutamate kinase [Planctomycetota bacterium]NOG56059.1 acetylglutamate kinase [Planctomycetota bacterium]